MDNIMLTSCQTGPAQQRSVEKLTAFGQGTRAFAHRLYIYIDAEVLSCHFEI